MGRGLRGGDGLHHLMQSYPRFIIQNVMFTEIRFNHFSLKFLSVLGVSVVQFLFLCFAALRFKPVFSNRFLGFFSRYNNLKQVAEVLKLLSGEKVG